MTKLPERDLTALMQNDALLDAAVADAQAAAVYRHRLLGEPVVFWRDGRVVVDTERSATPAAEPSEPGDEI